MKKPCRVAVLALTLAAVYRLLPTAAHAAPVISNITSNSDSVPRFAKYELTFQVQTAAPNPQFSYSPNAYPGSDLYPEDLGVTVNAQFLPPGQTDWANAYLQPAFYYQDFRLESHATGYGTDWLYPTGAKAFKVRFAPSQTGIWQYRLVAIDSTGSLTTPPQSLTVTASENPGFIRIASGDRRYFEFQNGTYFPALGYNMNYNHIDWVNPSLNQAHFTAMAQNGIQLVRLWLSQWSIFGSHWSPWREAASNGNDPPWTWLVHDPAANPSTEFAFQVTNNPDRCFSYGLNTPHPPVKPSTTYRLRASVRTLGLAGPAAPGDWGFVVKLAAQTGACQLPTTGTKVTPLLSQTTSGYQIVEGTFTTGSNQYFLPFIVFALENTAAGSAHVRYLWLEEVLDTNQYGPNLIAKPGLDSHRYFDQRNAYAFDLVVDQAQASGVYLRPVILDWREDILDHFDWNGIYTASANDGYLYGPADPTQLNRSRYLQREWWRYLQARWGYATSIHSFEFVNEGTTALEHARGADAFGRFFDQFTGNPHLTSTSTWNQSNSTAGHWNLSALTGIDFADIHRYIRQDTMAGQFFDAAGASLTASAAFGGSSSAIQSRWPVIRGETGFVTSDSLSPQSPITADSYGIWLHNFLWAGLNPGALIESYWFENWHIYDCPSGTSPCRLRFDFRPQFKPLADFLADIPLNQGGYVDAAVTGYDPAAIRVTGQKHPSRNLAHLWVQNPRHTWCAVAGNVAGCPATWDHSRLSGSLTLTGLAATTPLPIEWWQFNSNGELTKTTTSQTPAGGTLTLNLNTLLATTTDVAIKIGNYSAAPAPSPSPPPNPDYDLDGDTDWLDFSYLVRYFGNPFTLFDLNRLINFL